MHSVTIRKGSHFVFCNALKEMSDLRKLHFNAFNFNAYFHAITAFNESLQERVGFQFAFLSAVCYGNYDNIRYRLHCDADAFGVGGCLIKHALKPRSFEWLIEDYK